jgi:hypothetical protein
VSASRSADNSTCFVINEEGGGGASSVMHSLRSLLLTAFVLEQAGSIILWGHQAHTADSGVILSPVLVTQKLYP